MDVVCTIFFAKYCCCFYLMLMFSFLIRVCQRCYLYGAVLDKGRSPIPSGKANKQASTLPGKYCTFLLILSHPPRILNGLTKAVLYLYLKSFFFSNDVCRILYPWLRTEPKAVRHDSCTKKRGKFNVCIMYRI